MHADSLTVPLPGVAAVELAPEVGIEKLMTQMEADPKPAAGGKPGAPPANFNLFAQPPVFLTLKSTTGLHDVYFVFKNSAAKPIQPLMSLSSINFMDK